MIILISIWSSKPSPSSACGMDITIATLCMSLKKNNNERDDIVGKLTRYWYTPEGLPTATATCSLAINDADQASSWISSLHHHCILIASSSSSSPSSFFVRRIVFSQITKLPRPMAAWGDYYDLKSNSQMSTFSRIVDLVMIPPCCDDFGQGSARIS